MTASHENLPSGLPYSSVNYTSSISINICCHVSGPVLCSWDAVEKKTNTAPFLMVPTVKTKRLVSYDCSFYRLPPSAVASTSQLSDYPTVSLGGR